VNKIEQYLTAPDRQWVYTGAAFSTVVAGLGFVLYRERNQMWLIGLPREITAAQQNIHKRDNPLCLIGFWVPEYNSFTKRLFCIPASNEFVAEVVLRVYPEVTG